MRIASPDTQITHRRQYLELSEMAARDFGDRRPGGHGGGGVKLASERGRVPGAADRNSKRPNHPLLAVFGTGSDAREALGHMTPRLASTMAR